MNPRLNLLPWRAQRRQRRWQHSLLALAVSGLAGGGAWWWLDAGIEARVTALHQHQQILTQQLSALNADINAWEQHIQQQRLDAHARARRERDRLALVHLLDTLAQHTPAGVILNDVQQHGESVTLTAHAPTSAQMARCVQHWGSLNAGALTLSLITPAAQDNAGYTFTLSVPTPAVDLEPQGQLAVMEITP